MSQYIRTPLGRLRGRRGLLGLPTRGLLRGIDRGFRGLGQYYSASDVQASYGTTDPNAINSIIASDTRDLGPMTTAANPYGYGTSAVPGSISPQDAALLSTAITTAGKVGTQAIIGTPTETYNPLTGQYTATGGAVLPASIGLDSTISSYLPLILLGGGLILIISMAGKR